MNENILIIERRLFSAIGHERTQVNAINELIGNEKSIVIVEGKSMVKEGMKVKTVN